MANPNKSDSLLASKNNKPLISEQETYLADVAVTYTTNDPSITANQAITVADGSTPTVAELLEFCEELKAQCAKHAAVLKAHGLMADS
jgi:hypothetical protein